VSPANNNYPPHDKNQLTHPAMLEVVNLGKTYTRTPAVKDVSFTVRPGEVLGFLGPNGSGKTTTVNMLTGLLAPTTGEIRYGGVNIQDDPIAHKRRLGFVPEVPYIYPYLSGREYLQLAGRLRLIPDTVIEKKVNAFMELFSVGSDGYSPVSSYSKGMRQKILIAAALLHVPEILIFDEPLSGLDVTSAMIFKNLVQTLAAEGKIIFYSSHVLEVVEKVCTKVIILHKGAVVANDSVESLRGLMELSSLEAVFAQLVVKEDTRRVANDIVDAMKANS
jgi:ABC-2 type transport system ATP-binding protein